MDQKLLNALNNLSIALQEISDSMDDINKSKQSSNSSIVEAFKSLNITEQLKSIDTGVKKIQEDNKEIIKTQKKILTSITNPKIQNRNEEILKTQKKILTSLANPKVESRNDDISKYNKAADPKQQKNIKDGVKMVLLIAVGILAIGTAFRVIGKVDFLSVLSLSLALPLIAIAFEKVAGIKISLKQLSVATIGLIMMSGAIMLASKILQWVSPVSSLQLLTTVFIAGAFALLSFNLDKLSKGIENINAKNLWKLPLVLVAASIAIATSSWILQYVKPVGFSQLITIVLIAGAFAVLSFGLGKLVKSMDKIDLKGVALLPLVLVGVSI